MKALFFGLLRAACGLAAAILLTSLAGEIGALALDLRHARPVGAGLALCLGAALAAARPRLLTPAGLAAGLAVLALPASSLGLGRLAARWGVAGYYAALGLLFACAALSLGAALSLMRPRRARQSRRIRS
ncbi:MAG: hypothetical protein IKO07_10240 [Clostridia bacterium]|nr:hypothetical protein [Clostridia bacterium]